MIFFKTTTKKMSMQEAMQNLTQDSSIRLLDVRTSDEYNERHLPNSLHIPLDRIREATEKIPNKDSCIYVYCHSGARSQKACAELARLGYTDVTNIGGIVDWQG